MPDPIVPDDDSIRAARAYPARMSSQSTPPDLEQNAIRFALSRRRRVSIAALLGGSTIVIAGATAAAVALAFRNSPIASIPASTVTPSPSVAPVTITPGLVSPRATDIPQPTPSFTVSPNSSITLTGALNGRLRNIQLACGLHQIIGKEWESRYIEARGTLGGRDVQIDVFDPSGHGNWEGGWVLVQEILGSPAGADPYAFAPGTTYSGWRISVPIGVSNFSVSSGAVLDLTAQPTFQYSSPTVPTADLTARGQLAC